MSPSDKIAITGIVINASMIIVGWFVAWFIAKKTSQATLLAAKPVAKPKAKKTKKSVLALKTLRLAQLVCVFEVFWCVWDITSFFTSSEPISKLILAFAMVTSASLLTNAVAIIIVENAIKRVKRGDQEFINRITRKSDG